MIIFKNQETVVLSIFTIAMAYAILRYNIFQAVSFEHLPLYVANKAFALSVVLLMFYRPFIRENDCSFYNTAVFTLLLMHVFISITILSPEYYPKFFQESQMNLRGELSLLFGISAFVTFIVLQFILQKKKISLTFKLQVWAALILIAGHLLSMGLPGWFTPEKWSGYLPPISLIAFVILVMITVHKRSRFSPSKRQITTF